MTERIRKEIERKGFADTKKYRYQLFETSSARMIKRIEISKLDTTAALNGWEIVEIQTLWD